MPDEICNAGGVTVSYFERVQDFSSFFWTEDEINARLDKIIVEALGKICDTAGRRKISGRTAAFVVACERILHARRARALPLRPARQREVQAHAAKDGEAQPVVQAKGTEATLPGTFANQRVVP